MCSKYVQGWLSRFVVKIGCQDRLSRLVVKIVVIASSVSFFGIFFPPNYDVLTSI